MLERGAAHRQRLVLGHTDVRAGQSVGGRMGDLAAGERAQLAGRAHMIRMDVRVERVRQTQAQLLDQRQVALAGC